MGSGRLKRHRRRDIRILGRQAGRSDQYPPKGRGRCDCRAKAEAVGESAGLQCVDGAWFGIEYKGMEKIITNVVHESGSDAETLGDSRQ